MIRNACQSTVKSTCCCSIHVTKPGHVDALPRRLCHYPVMSVVIVNMRIFRPFVAIKAFLTFATTSLVCGCFWLCVFLSACLTDLCFVCVCVRGFCFFLFLMYQVTNTISFGFSLLGTSMVIRRLGLKTTLLAFPCMCLGVVIMVMTFPRLYVS